MGQQEMTGLKVIGINTDLERREISISFEYRLSNQSKKNPIDKNTLPPQAFSNVAHDSDCYNRSSNRLAMGKKIL
jgi:hypothetical protein